jgi:hypothetical protein
MQTMKTCPYNDLTKQSHVGTDYMKKAPSRKQRKRELGGNP